MPLPLAPFLPIALRLGAVAATGFAIKRALAARTHVGHTDQRAVDAMDEQAEGLALHRSAQLGADGAEDSQHNAAGRFRRVIRVAGKSIEIDAGFLARLRIRKL